MTYRNLTREALVRQRALKGQAMTSDGAWLDWPTPFEPKQRKRMRAKTSRTGRWKIAKAFRPGSGRYS